MTWVIKVDSISRGVCLKNKESGFWTRKEAQHIHIDVLQREIS